MNESDGFEFTQEEATDLVERAIQEAQFNLSLQGSPFRNVLGFWTAHLHHRPTGREFQVRFLEKVISEEDLRVLIRHKLIEMGALGETDSEG